MAKEDTSTTAESVASFLELVAPFVEQKMAGGIAVALDAGNYMTATHC